MWWSDRRRLIVLAAAAALSGCAGYAPVHAPNGPGTALRGQVRVADPVSAETYVFLREAERALGQPGPAPRFDLTYGLSLSEEGAGRTRQGAVTRYVLTATLDWQLREGETPRASGRLIERTTWSAASSNLATNAAQDDARRRLMRLLADRLASRLTAEAARSGGWR